jgi:phospho-2-dehydro-3-deoxyheptonate aldolase
MTMVLLDAGASAHALPRWSVGTRVYKRQLIVGRDVASQISRGDFRIMGVMIESFLVEGQQNANTFKSS